MATLTDMGVATGRCHINRRSDTVSTVPRPATGKTFVARARVPREKWERLEEAAESMGTDRSKLINEFADWYLRVRGAKLPERPSAKSRRPEVAG